MANTLSFRRRLPAVLLRFWSRNLDAVTDLIGSWRLPNQEVVSLGSGLYGLLPGAGEAELVESAYMLAQRVFLASPAGSRIRALILPGQIDVDPRGARLVPDALLDDLDGQAPQLEDRTVFLSGYAIREMEGAWNLARQEKYRGPSGRSCPLFSLGEPRTRPVEWTNPELLGKKPHVIERNL